jgi:anti-sigma factor RsiW
VWGVRTRTPQPADGVTDEQLVALADGTLSDPERAEVEARVAASPEAIEQLEAQRRALAAIHAFDPPLPKGFEAAPDVADAADRDGAAPAPRTAAAAPRRARLRTALAVAGGVAVLILAILVAPGERGGTVASMAALSALRAAEPAPRPADEEGRLQREFAGVTFPDWERAHGWRAVGARRDRVDGQATDTVFYVHTHHRIGYSVLSGAPAAIPTRGRRVVRDGVPVQLYRDGRRTVAVFERGGRTCVLAGVVHRDETLVKLATWRAGGTLRF